MLQTMTWGCWGCLLAAKSGVRFDRYQHQRYVAATTIVALLPRHQQAPLPPLPHTLLRCFQAVRLHPAARSLRAPRWLRNLLQHSAARRYASRRWHVQLHRLCHPWHQHAFPTQRHLSIGRRAASCSSWTLTRTQLWSRTMMMMMMMMMMVLLPFPRSHQRCRHQCRQGFQCRQSSRPQQQHSFPLWGGPRCA